MSVGRAATHLQPHKGATSRPTTSQDLGDKAAYFDEYLSSVDALKDLKLMSHIGKGAFSVVSLALGKDGKASYAVKAYEKIDALDWNRLAYIKREVRHLKMLNSPRVVKLVDLVK
jgi:serine/threonine protein kinase